jgi:transcription initiation factor TFIID subunit 8
MLTLSDVAKLLSYVTESMLGARRPQPTPVDFEFAMRRAGLTSRLLKPHLNPPVSRTKTQLNYLPADPEEIIPQPVPGLLGKELDGATEKRAKGFIPEHFPGFPSKHTYKATEHIAEREKDPRKIREQATEAARCAEGSLRRLVQVGKAGDGKVPKKISGKGDKQRLNRELWEKAMEDIGASILQPRTIDRMDAKEQNIKVDAGKPYWRKNVARRKVQSSSKE